MATDCRFPGCDKSVVAKGWCRKHYSQQRRGRLENPASPKDGDPDGYGRYGVLDRDEWTVACHECGRRFDRLGPHLLRDHEMTVRAYQDAHGLPRIGLVSLGTSSAMSMRARRNVGTPGWGRFEASRDPAAASRARESEDMRTPAVRRARVAESPALLAKLRGSGKVKTCPRCGAGYQGPGKTCGSDDCVRWVRRRPRQKTPRLSDARAVWLRESRMNRVPILLAEGWSRAAIAEALGVTPSWLTKHFPR